MNRGYTLLEVLIAAALIGGVVLFATSTIDSLSNAGDAEQAQLEEVSSNQRILLFLANDLQSSSSDTNPDTGEPRFKLEAGLPVVGLRDKVSTPSGEDSGYLKVGPDGSTQTVPEALDTPEERLAAGVLGTGLDRARDTTVTTNSVFTFQKVVGYEIDSGTGEVGPIWSSPIRYAVNAERQLTRLEEGVERVIGQHVTLFDVRVGDIGNFVVTLVTERHDTKKGRVVQVANRIEVHPKNR